MKKFYVFDTNVLLYDPDCIFNFVGKNIYIVIPITVIEEIDKFKKESTELGRNARQFSRNIEKLRSNSDITKGAKINNGTTLIIKIPQKNLQHYCDYCFIGDEGDNRILATALNVQEEHKNTKVIFLSKDINLRIKASSLGLDSRDYEEREIAKFEEHYYGWEDIIASEEIIAKLYEDKKLNIDQLPNIKLFYPNHFLLIKSETNPNHTALASYNHSLKEVALFDTKFSRSNLWGLKPRNKEQIFALNLLLNPEIKLVSLIGKAGTGKTLLALAAGLNQVIDTGFYKKLVVARPIFPMGKDLGFLPGDVEEKLHPWMGPIFDNLDFLSNSQNSDSNYKFLMDKKLIELEPLTYIRGRSIANQYLVIDEAQNLTPHEVKTIITRAGEDTKIVLTGDPYQIDTPYLDATTNGLIYLLEKFKNEDIAGTVTLTKGERSRLAELASNLL